MLTANIGFYNAAKGRLGIRHRKKVYSKIDFCSGKCETEFKSLIRSEHKNGEGTTCERLAAESVNRKARCPNCNKKMK